MKQLMKLWRVSTKYGGDPLYEVLQIKLMDERTV